MPTYLYCLLGSGLARAPEGGVGIDGASVRALRLSSLEGWVSDVASTPIATTVERARAHDAVIGHAVSSGITPLPCRFGQLFASDEVVQSELGPKLPDLEARLRELDGLVEMRVRLTIDEPPDEVVVQAEAETPGHRYLEGLRRESNRRARLARLMRGVARTANSAASDVIRAEVVLLDPRRPLECTVAHLVARVDVGRYCERVSSALGEAHEGDGGLARSFVVLGPTAPYSFTTIDADRR